MRSLANRCLGSVEFRSKHVRRYAFAGDSYTFGQGVALDETLPACCERYLNAMVGTCPAEAVNLGVCGHNLWNSWLAFKRLPQVYDGLVLTLCSNDAQLLQRTFQQPYGTGPAQRQRCWSPEHAYRQVIAECFDDIASFGRASALPIVICYYSVRDNRILRQIGRWIGELCEERAIVFVDLWQGLAARRLNPLDLIVSEFDLHASALAHDLAARYLIGRLRDEHWFQRGATAGAQARELPHQILAAADEMAKAGCYTGDAALRWALAALDSVERGVGRSIAVEQTGEFQAQVRDARERLQADRIHWHAEARLAAVLAGEIFSPGGTVEERFRRCDEERLRLEELCALASSRNGSSAIAALPAPFAADGPTPALNDREIGERLGQLWHATGALKARLDAAQANASGLRRGAQELARLRTHLAEIVSLVVSCRGRISSLRALALLCRENEEDTEGGELRNQFQVSWARAIECLEEIERRLDSAFEVVPVTSDYMTVEVSLETEHGDGRQIAAFCLRVHPGAPPGPRTEEWAYFAANGTRALLQFKLPIVYAGRFAFSIANAHCHMRAVQASVVRLIVRGPTGVCKTLQPGAWVETDGTWSLSSNVCLA